MELSYIFSKEILSYISGNGNPETENPKKASYIPKTKPCTFQTKLKTLLYFRKRKSRKNFLCFRKQKSEKKNYISGKEYSKPWHNKNFLIIQERNIQNPGITELSYISRNGALYLYIFLIFQ